MSVLARLLASAGHPALDVAKVFSTDLYTGNGTAQTITNGINLTNGSGLVWVKDRSASNSHALVDTERGAQQTLASDTTGAEAAASTVTGFNANGFDIGSAGSANTNANTYAAWTFRKARRFFDVVIYTGDGTAGRTISHDLGTEPGMIIVKSRSATGNWSTYQREHTSTVPEQYHMTLNTTGTVTKSSAYWNDTAPTATQFTLGAGAAVNASGATYVAYLFAHDTESNGVVQCGSYTGNGSATGPTVTLGWEPQWLLIKRADGISYGYIMDAARGIGAGADPYVYANTSGTETTVAELVEASSTGFQIKNTAADINANGSRYIYVAIRAEGA